MFKLFAAKGIWKTVLCLRYYRSLKWLRPVTDEGRLALEEFKKQRVMK